MNGRRIQFCAKELDSQAFGIGAAAIVQRDLVYTVAVDDHEVVARSDDRVHTFLANSMPQLDTEA